MGRKNHVGEEIGEDVIRIKENKLEDYECPKFVLSILENGGLRNHGRKGLSSQCWEEE